MKYISLLLLLFTTLTSNDDLINVNFKDLSLMELINITSKKIQKNILITNKIDGKVDFISNKPIKKNELLNILKFSLNEYGYEIVENDSILRVVKKGTIKKKPIIKKLIKEKKASKEIFDTRFIQLINVEAKSIEAILKKIITQRKYKKENIPTIAIDEQNNSIIIDGKSNIVLDFISIIKKLDVIKSQVYVKAKIIEIDDNLIEEIGIKYGILGGNVYSGNILTFSSSLNEGSAIAIDTSSIGLTIPNVSSSLALGASLSLLNKTYALDIISEPSILCLNNIESSIYVGETISIQTGSTVTDGGTTTNTYEREDIGLTLKVKPRVFKNKVLIDINTILEGIKNTNTTNSNPDTSKKEVKTSAIVNNGESVILGGLIESRNEKSVQKIPFASDIPLIGELFKNRQNDKRKKSLAVIVTPYIVPKNKDITYIRNELSKLKSLEDNFLKEVLIKLRNKKLVKNEKIKETQSNEELHKKRLKEYFGI